ncbi:hypothetical protein LCER1_G008362 [Lachnellula cervina]|uniref:Uncharacterized protein n=1 Tax=Lachnellula cervina TaxID=1316786 RepID=A0A7D8UJN2_9HELO|nr:hypothetical protein LCER1_G008362 [Lachnellula cervina]
MLIDKNGFDVVLVIINRLGKQPITIPYYKTAILRDLAQMQLSINGRLTQTTNIIQLEYASTTLTFLRTELLRHKNEIRCSAKWITRDNFALALELLSNFKIHNFFSSNKL